MDIENSNLKLTGFRIKKMRLDKNWTQKDLAKKLGLKNDTAIANYEAGYSVPKDEIKLKMCDLFNCTMDYLMGQSDFETKEEELDDYLNNEIKDDLIKKLKSLELDKADLEKAVTAFIENHMIVTDNYSVKIYEMEDSLIYYAYELITKYYFKLINAELSSITNNSNLLTDKQDYFEQAEEKAWIKMKNILEEIDENEIISNLTIEEKVEKFLYNLGNKKVFNIPILGKIPAGEPIFAGEYLEGYLPVDPNIYGMTTADDYFYLRVSGESMNLKVHNGDYALIHKQDYAENGDIIVAIVNGDDEATLKRYKKINDEIIMLEPMSTYPMEPIVINLKETKFQIIGKAIGQFGKF